MGYLQNRLILVAGPPRGGTTWFGKMLSEASEASYIFEPIIHHRHPITKYTSELSAYFKLDKWYVDFDDSDEQIAKIERSIRLHTEELVKVYFGNKVQDLVVKIPQTEKIGVFERALNADKIIYIKRHPLALLNSYDKSWLYKGWRVKEDYQLLLRDLPALESNFDVISSSGHFGESDIMLTVFHARNCLIDRVLRGRDALLLDYESLAAEPIVEFEKVFEWLGWNWSSETQRKCSKYFFSSNEGKGFLDVQKESSSRIHSWRKELAPWHIKRGYSLLERLQSEYVRGESDELGIRDMYSGIQTYVKRRAWRLKLTFIAGLANVKKIIIG